MVELVWLRRSLNAALRAPSIGVMNGDKLTFPCPHCATLNRAPVARLAHHSIAAVRLEVALIGVGGLLATYWLGLQVIGRRAPALLIAATIALGPLWGPLAEIGRAHV